MSEAIASFCLTAQTCALCPGLPPATVSCCSSSGTMGALWGGTCSEPEPRLWGNPATNCWACHPSREATKHFNGHLPNTSICWSIHASLPLEIHLLLKWIFRTSLFTQMTYLMYSLFFMKWLFVFLFPKFPIFQVHICILFSLKVMHILMDSSSSSGSLLLLLLQL